MPGHAIDLRQSNIKRKENAIKKVIDRFYCDDNNEQKKIDSFYYYLRGNLQLLRISKQLNLNIFLNTTKTN